MLGYCLCPLGLFYNNESFGFGGLSPCKKALQATGEYFPHEVKNLHVHTCVWYLLWNRKFCCLCFVHKSNAQESRRES